MASAAEKLVIFSVDDLRTVVREEVQTAVRSKADDDILTSDDVARLAGVTRTTVSKWAKAGLKRQPGARKLVFRRGDVQHWLEQQEAKRNGGR
jgi:hypothetical protein